MYSQFFLDDLLLFRFRILTILPMQLEALQVFCDLVNLRSFSKTAEANGTSQPTVSRLVHQLEVRLGGQLIDRSKRPLQLTAIGQGLLRGLQAAAGAVPGAGGVASAATEAGMPDRGRAWRPSTPSAWATWASTSSASRASTRTPRSTSTTCTPTRCTSRCSTGRPTSAWSPSPRRSPELDGAALARGGDGRRLLAGPPAGRPGAVAAAELEARSSSPSTGG